MNRRRYLQAIFLVIGGCRAPIAEELRPRNMNEPDVRLRRGRIVLDGVYVRGADGRLSFRRVIPHEEDVEHLVGEIADACERWLDGQGRGQQEDEASPSDEAEESLSLLQQASIGGYVAVGPRARKPVRRVQTVGGREVPLTPRTATCDGYNLNAGVSVAAEDRAGLERLCRYVLRPPLAKGRLTRSGSWRWCPRRARTRCSIEGSRTPRGGRRWRHPRPRSGRSRRSSRSGRC